MRLTISKSGTAVSCLLITGISLWIAGCRRSDGNVVLETELPESADGTADPVLAMTLHADVRTTAQWVATLPPVLTATPMPLPTFDGASAVGTPPGMRTGTCPIPEGYDLHDREGFCIAAPDAWVALNVDGGGAVTLNTTPGQVITLQPEWASSTDICQLTIYVAVGGSAQEHLEVRHAQFAANPDLESLSPIGMRSLGTLIMPGFAWSVGGASGGIYADRMGTNRLVHVSMGGQQCTLEEMIPVLETLRFD